MLIPVHAGRVFLYMLVNEVFEELMLAVTGFWGTSSSSSSSSSLLLSSLDLSDTKVYEP